MKKRLKSEGKGISLEKFKVAEIKNKNVIVGGAIDPPITTTTVRGNAIL
ncbi:hypothetical protein [Flavobacterium cupreum]|nr:hypothetical protein [Flavobacterium cupreum]